MKLNNKPNNYPLLKVSDLSYKYNNHQEEQIFEKINFNIKPREFVVIFGPNGCGKTTLLKLVAGFIKPKLGDVKLKNKCQISYVFQDYRRALFPWLKVIDNIALPLKLKGLHKAQRREEVKKLVNKLGVKLNLNAYPYQLSSGQQQIVAILRSIIKPVDFMIMDEPFSALDYNTNLLMEQKLLTIWEKYKLTILFVTHAAGEAVLLADRILVLSGKPARIMANIKVDLPRPRPYTIITTPEFNKIKNQVIDASFMKLDKESI